MSETLGEGVCLPALPDGLKPMIDMPPIDPWAKARVGDHLMVYYTAGWVIICSDGEFANAEWDIVCDLYLPDGATTSGSTHDYEYCGNCRREFFYFEL